MTKAEEAIWLAEEEERKKVEAEIKRIEDHRLAREAEIRRIRQERVDFRTDEITELTVRLSIFLFTNLRTKS